MNNKISIVALILALLAIGYSFLGKKSVKTDVVVKTESTYDRIMRTKTIRCAYLITPIFMKKDPNTGKFSGPSYDLMEKMGKDWGLNIVWAEEVGAASMFEGLRTGRIDMLCTPLTTAPARTLIVDFTRTVGFLPYYLYSRADDVRFDNAYEKANEENITMMTFDGYFGGILTKDKFPKAKLISLPDLTNDTDVLLGISTGKADTAVCGTVAADQFMENNLGKIRQVAGEPVRFVSMKIAVPIGEEKLKSMIDSTLNYYLETGDMDMIFNKHGLDDAKFLRVARPYREAEGK